MLGKKTIENVILKAAVELARERKRMARIVASFAPRQLVSFFFSLMLRRAPNMQRLIFNRDPPAMNQLPHFSSADTSRDFSIKEQSITAEQKSFLIQIAMLLGIPASSHAELVAPMAITGPSGLDCRLHLLDGHCSVFPEIVLPLSVNELMGPEVGQLLEIQRMLLIEFGWYLGVSAEGLLQLSSIAWIDEVHEIVKTLDLMNGIGIMAIQQLLDSAKATH